MLQKPPYRDLSTTLAILVKNRNWQWINGLGVLGASAGLLGQAGIYIFHLPKAGLFTVAGYYITTLGTTLLLGTMLWDTILWPILVNHDESLLSFQGPVYLSSLFNFLCHFLIDIQCRYRSRGDRNRSGKHVACGGRLSGCSRIAALWFRSNV